MFTYSTDVLHLSEHEAYLRIEVARASRKHPVLLEMLADGRLHLSGVALLHRHLTKDNRETLLRAAAYKSKRQIEELVAELSPKPDVPTTMRKLPERRGEAKPTLGTQLVPDRVEPKNPAPATPQAPAPARPAVVKPIAPARYKVEFTASGELRDKLERLRALMRSSGNDVDLATVIEDAVTEKLERLEAKRFGKTKTPRKSLEETDTSTSSRTIPAAVKRAVCERDRYQCTYEDESGRRCTETERLEFHHLHAYGRGGDHDPSNIRLVCRTHNLYLAEYDYGKEVMGRYRRPSNRVSEPSIAYTAGSRATRASPPVM
jgi:5-methylcytosine-specific restriction endonuclease McrA